MTQTVFEKMKTAISVLKLDFTTEEFATFADDQELSEEAIEAVQTVFSYISEKKQQTTVQTLLKLSRLPKKAPKTFENFDFSLLKSRDLDQQTVNIRDKLYLALLGRGLFAPQSGLYWTAWNRKNAFGAGIWLCLLPAWNAGLFH